MGSDGFEVREDAMHRHEYEPAEPAPRVREQRRRDDEALHVSAAARAATSGRTDALGAASVLRLQRAAGNAGIAQLLESEEQSPVHDVVGKGGGTPLDDSTRGRMEDQFGSDFSDVRVHTGSTAAGSAQAVDAQAYTVGNEIVLGGSTGPGSSGFDRTLAHELTHVVQQRSGPVEGTPAGGGISISNPSDRFEQAAEATADQVMSGGRAPETAGAGAGGSVQRQGPEEEEEVQALALQRQGPEEEEEVQALAIQRIQREEEEEPLLL
jgi:hypothetical protein